MEIESSSVSGRLSAIGVSGIWIDSSSLMKSFQPLRK
jgi:hypothetical protein